MNIPFITDSKNFYLWYAIGLVILFTALLSFLLNKGFRGISAIKVFTWSLVILIIFGSLHLVYETSKKEENNKVTTVTEKIKK
jgi:hypothetical protein